MEEQQQHTLAEKYVQDYKNASTLNHNNNNNKKTNENEKKTFIVEPINGGLPLQNNDINNNNEPQVQVVALAAENVELIKNDDSKTTTNVSSIRSIHVDDNLATDETITITTITDEMGSFVEEDTTIIQVHNMVNDNHQEEIYIENEQNEDEVNEEMMQDMSTILQMLESACVDDASKEALKELKELEQARIFKLQELNALKTQYTEEKSALENALKSLDNVSADLDQLYDLNGQTTIGEESRVDDDLAIENRPTIDSDLSMLSSRTEDSADLSTPEKEESNDKVNEQQSIQEELNQLLNLKDALMKKREFILSEYRNLIQYSGDEDESLSASAEQTMEVGNGNNIEELIMRLQSSSVGDADRLNNLLTDVEPVETVSSTQKLETPQKRQPTKDTESNSNQASLGTTGSLQEELELDGAFFNDPEKLGEYTEMIDSWIEKILMQLLELNQISESGAGETEQIKALRVKLFERLEELQDIKEKINYYQSLLDDYERLKDAKIDLETFDEAQKLKRRNAKQIKEVVEEDEQPKTWVEHAQVKEVKLTETSPSQKKTVRFAEDVKQVEDDNNQEAEVDEEATVAVETIRHDDPSRFKSSTLNHVIEVSDELNDQKKLFHSVKDKIYKGAANLISLNEEEPFFLNYLFKNVGKMDTPYLRQRLMLAIEEILEEQEL